MLLTDYCRLVEVILCALVLQQPQVSSCVETAANDVQFAVEVTDGGVTACHRTGNTRLDSVNK